MLRGSIVGRLGQALASHGRCTILVFQRSLEAVRQRALFLCHITGINLYLRLCRIDHSGDRLKAAIGVLVRGRTRRHRDALGRFFVQIRQLNQHIGQVFLDCDLIRTGDIGLIALVLYICADVQRGNRLIAILSLVKGTPLDGQGLDSGVRTAEISGARAIFAAAGRDFDNRLVTAIAAEGSVLDVDNRILNTNQVQVDGVIAGGVRTIHRTSSIVLKRAAGHGQFLDVGQVQGLLDIVLNRAVLQRQGQLRQVIADLLILCLDSKALCLVPVQRQVFHGELGRFLVGISCRAGDLTGQGEFRTDALNREIGTGGERHILCDVPQNLNGAGAVCLNCG